MAQPLRSSRAPTCGAQRQCSLAWRCRQQNPTFAAKHPITARYPVHILASRCNTAIALHCGPVKTGMGLTFCNLPAGRSSQKTCLLGVACGLGTWARQSKTIRLASFKDEEPPRTAMPALLPLDLETPDSGGACVIDSHSSLTAIHLTFSCFLNLDHPTSPAGQIHLIPGADIDRHHPDCDSSPTCSARYALAN